MSLVVGGMWVQIIAVSIYLTFRMVIKHGTPSYFFPTDSKRLTTYSENVGSNLFQYTLLECPYPAAQRLNLKLLEEQPGLDLTDGDGVFFGIERRVKDHLHPRGHPQVR
jgi:hypothetical protein